jgi:hypothetical protein
MPGDLLVRRYLDQESSGRHTGGSDIPGAGWHGFDPTNNKHAGNEHVSVAVTREQEKAVPISGV